MAEVGQSQSHFRAAYVNLAEEEDDDDDDDDDVEEEDDDDGRPFRCHQVVVNEDQHQRSVIFFWVAAGFLIERCRYFSG